MATKTYPTNLESIVHDLGVTVRTAITPNNWWGVYDHKYKLITLHPQLSPIQYRCTLTHELGHAHFEHQGVTGKQEAQANKWAAHKLLTVDQVLEHARTELHTQELAALLGVLPSVLKTFIATLDYSSTQRMLTELRKPS